MLEFFDYKVGTYYIRCNNCGAESCGYLRPIPGVDDWLDLCLFCAYVDNESNNVEGFMIRKPKINA